MYNPQLDTFLRVADAGSPAMKSPLRSAPLTGSASFGIKIKF